MRLDCKYWNEDKGEWRTDGVSTELSADFTTVSCVTTHLTSFGGVISIPTSADELLDELKEALKFNTFTIDEAFNVLKNFNVAKNPTIVAIIALLTALDLCTLGLLGCFRGRRKRLNRKREMRMYPVEQIEEDFHELERRRRTLAARASQAERLQAKLAKCGSSKVLTCTRSSFARSLMGRSSQMLSRPYVKTSPLAPAAAPPRVHAAALDAPNTQAPSPPPSPPHERLGRLFGVYNPTAPDGRRGHSSRRRGHSSRASAELSAAAKRTARITNSTQRRQGTQPPHRIVPLAGAPGTAEYPVPQPRTRCSTRLGDFCGRLCDVMRSEHTVFNLISPPDDEEALQQPQIVQLFWNTIAIELLVSCFFADADDESIGVKRSRRDIVAASQNDANELQDAATVGISTFEIAPVTAISQGLVAALITISVIVICAYVFRLGNSRQWKPHSAKGYVRSIRKAWRGKLRKRDPDLTHLDPPPEGMRYVEVRVLSFTGWVFLIGGCMACPGLNLLALVFCWRKRYRLVPATADSEQGLAGPSVVSDSRPTAVVVGQSVSNALQGSDAGAAAMGAAQDAEHNSRAPTLCSPVSPRIHDAMTLDNASHEITPVATPRYRDDGTQLGSAPESGVSPKAGALTNEAAAGDSALGIPPATTEEAQVCSPRAHNSSPPPSPPAGALTNAVMKVKESCARAEDADELEQNAAFINQLREVMAGSRIPFT